MPSGLQEPDLDEGRLSCPSFIEMTATCACWLLAATLTVTSGCSSPAQAQTPAASATPADARLVAMPPFVAGRSILPERARPTSEETPRKVCSFVAPVCVHAAADVTDASILHVLQAAEKFYLTVWALGLPEPLPDGRLGGDSRVDLYLLPDVPRAKTIADWIVAGSAWDHASAFTVMPPPASPFGCDTEAGVAQSLAHAAVLRLDAGAADAALAMAETHVADIVADCPIMTIPAVDVFQRFPERLLGHRAAHEPSGALLFARYLDDSYGLGTPAGVLFSLLAVAGQKTSPLALNFANEPDLFDALRSNMKARGKPFEDLLLDFAIARAFVGSRSDGGHLSDVDKFGDAGRVRFEWSVPYQTLPRRLAPLRPIEPTGATYLWVDLQGAPEDLELAFVADWETGVLFHWAIIKVDAAGIDIGRISMAAINGATHAERSIVGLRGVAGLIVVGVNVGSIDRSRPFDPDELEMPRSYTVTLIK